MNQSFTVGWDVGGAHLKAAMLDQHGHLLQVKQVPCALWQGLAMLEVAIDQIMEELNRDGVLKHPILHAVTMTGELVDLFQNRQAGVLAISELMQQKLMGDVLFYSASQDKAQGKASAKAFDFIDYSDVTQCWQSMVSVNWHASASLIATKINDALLVDIGSTTTDFIPLVNGQVRCVGFSDAARMQSQELVYTGVVRTPLMAVAQSVDFCGVKTSVAAEYFATTADVYRLSHELQPSHDMAATADGAEKSLLASARRIARMIGHDVDDANMSAWTDLALAFKTQQLTRLTEVALVHIARMANTHDASKTLTIIGAGAGAFLVKQLAEWLAPQVAHQFNAVQYVEVSDLIPLASETLKQEANKPNQHLASVCLPAYAVAVLAHQTSLQLQKN